MASALYAAAIEAVHRIVANAPSEPRSVRPSAILVLRSSLLGRIRLSDIQMSIGTLVGVAPHQNQKTQIFPAAQITHIRPSVVRMDPSDAARLTAVRRLRSMTVDVQVQRGAETLHKHHGTSVAGRASMQPSPADTRNHAVDCAAHPRQGRRCGSVASRNRRA